MNRPRWNPSIFHSQGKIALESTSVQAFTYDQQEPAAKVELMSHAVDAVIDLSVTNVISTEITMTTKQRLGSTWNYSGIFIF